MAAPAFIQASSLTVAAASNTDIVLPGVVSGSTLALIITTANDSRTYTVSDDVNGAWTKAVESNSTGRRSIMYYFIGSGSGTVTITIDQSSTFQAYSVLAIEIGPSTLDVTGFVEDATNSGTHYCAASGSLDTAANVLVFSGGQLNSTGGTMTKNASATLLASDTTRLMQYRTSDTALTDERSEWTSSTSRATYTVSASFTAGGGGGGFQAAWARGSNVLIGM